MGKDVSRAFVLAVDPRFADLDQMCVTNSHRKSQAISARLAGRANAEIELHFSAVLGFVPTFRLSGTVVG